METVERQYSEGFLHDLADLLELCKNNNTNSVTVDFTMGGKKLKMDITFSIEGENNIVIRPFTHADIDDVIEMDDESGNSVSQWVENLDDTDGNDYSWGIYVNNVLAGYCTIGYADDIYPVIENHPLHGDEAYLLSDVYVKPAFRHRGYGLRLIKGAIEGRFAKETKLPVFLQMLVSHDELRYFYQKAGFEWIPDDKGYICMVYDPNKQDK